MSGAQGTSSPAVSAVDTSPPHLPRWTQGCPRGWVPSENCRPDSGRTTFGEDPPTSVVVPGAHEVELRTPVSERPLVYRVQLLRRKLPRALVPAVRSRVLPLPLARREPLLQVTKNSDFSGVASRSLATDDLGAPLETESPSPKSCDLNSVETPPRQSRRVNRRPHSRTPGPTSVWVRIRVRTRVHYGRGRSRKQDVTPLGTRRHTGPTRTLSGPTRAPLSSFRGPGPRVDVRRPTSPSRPVSPATPSRPSSGRLPGAVPPLCPQTSEMVREGPGARVGRPADSTHLFLCRSRSPLCKTYL